MGNKEYGGSESDERSGSESTLRLVAEISREAIWSEKIRFVLDIHENPNHPPFKVHAIMPGNARNF